jgi:fatty acid CoA ligase FadD9
MSASQKEVTSSSIAENPADRLLRRISELTSTDTQFRDAMPLPSVNEQRFRPELSLAQTMATVMEAYADRPALAERVRERVTDPVTGQTAMRLLPEFRTMTYRELWSRVRSLAAFWHHSPTMRIGVGDFVCVLAFAGIDYVIVDLAAIYVGAVFVPIQTNATLPQLVEIVSETEPQFIATSITSLPTAVEIVLLTKRPASLILFDYEASNDAQRKVYEAARQRLAEAQCSTTIDLLDALCDQGRDLPPAPLYLRAAGENPLSTIYYTSGSTGSPKGAMYQEQMVKGTWRVGNSLPLICLHYMPMNHSFGRSNVFMALGSGGTCYFTAESDLSTFIEDLRLVRPTQMALVPRICEMIFQHYQSEMQRRSPHSAGAEALAEAVMVEMRQQFLGGRILSALFGSAPMTDELTSFMETCLDITLSKNYGTTETSGITVNNQVIRPPVIACKLVDVPELGYYHTDKPYPRGELLVKTSNIMAGYYKRPDLTAAVFDADGYYKTGDIMAEIGTDRIVYVDRRNNVLKLAQGEFVAIAHLESVFTSGNPLIQQVYLYGRSEWSYLLAVIVPNVELLASLTNGVSEVDIKQKLRGAIKEIADAEHLNAYEVPRDFIVEREAFTAENGLLAGIGKYLRQALKHRYAERLEKLHADIAANQAKELSALRGSGRKGAILDTVARAVLATLGIDDVSLTENRSFSELGGDSLSALSFSLLLADIFEIEVPVGVITNPAGNLEHLAQYIEKALGSGSKRPSFASIHGRDATEIRASDLALSKFIDELTLAKAKNLPQPISASPQTVLLTGANGYLGRFLCLEWLERLANIGGKLICIVRARDEVSARRRIDAVFDSGDTALKLRVEKLAQGCLEVLPGDIGEPNLGLDDPTWERLAQAVDLIVHPAAFVNHLLPYGQLFGPNVVGTAELIRLALTRRLKPFINVSTMAVAMLGDGTVLSEDVDVRIASPVRSLNTGGYASGYANSKWAGEIMLREAHDRFGLPVCVFRSDMILAHSKYYGQINVPDMFTRWLYSLVITGLAPRSFYLAAPHGEAPHYDGLPVDFTAEAIVALGTGQPGGYRTYHVLNPHDDGISLDCFVDWVIEAGYSIQRVDDYDDWVTRFETSLRALPESQRQHSSLALIDQLRKPTSARMGAPQSAERFRSGVRELAIGPAKDIPHLSKQFILKCLDDLRQLDLIQTVAT